MSEMGVRTKPKKSQKPKEADKDQDEISSIDSSDEEVIFSHSLLLQCRQEANWYTKLEFS